MQKTWITIGIFIFAFCFLTGVVVSRTGLQWWVTLQNQGPVVSDHTPPPMSTGSTLEMGRSGPGPLSKLHAGEGMDVEEFFHKDPQIGLGMWPSVRPFSMQDIRLEGDHYVVDLDGGKKAILTLSVSMQEEMEALYGRYGVPEGSFVAVEPKTGNILSLVGYRHSETEENATHPALDASAPSASLFKTITAAALIEDQGFKPSDQVCWRGETAKTPTDEQIQGLHSESGLECTSFARAYGRSNNAVFSHLAWKHLSRKQVTSWAARLGYNERIPLDTRGFEPSSVELSKDPLEFARNAAGFWGSKLSPLHATLISAAIGNGGVMMRPNLIERIVDADGTDLYVHKAVPYKRVMREETARLMMDLMVRTTTVGTARSYFYEKPGLPSTNFTVGGKTGTLSRNRPYRMYSWFSGIASAEDPQVAITSLVCNPMKWKIKGGYAASQGLKEYVKAYVNTESKDAQDTQGDADTDLKDTKDESVQPPPSETEPTEPSHERDPEIETVPIDPNEL